MYHMKRPGREYLIGLNLIPELTPRRITILLEHFTSPQAIWHAQQKELSALPRFTADIASRIVNARSEQALDNELSETGKRNIEVITILDQEYPTLLRQIDDPPAVLYVIGEPRIDTAKALAIVGTRQSSRYGRIMASKLSRDLTSIGLTVVSGLAIGIDTAAHKGALEQGRTVAVLGSGLANIYPSSNTNLAVQISKQGGSLVSEYPLHTQPAKWTFPQRNRIISGLTRGVIVVEAPKRSGALITANLAMEQGREVFAVPGNVTSRASAGTNALIMDGAKLVTCVEDVVSEFPDLTQLLVSLTQEQSAGEVSLSAEEHLVYDMIGLEPLHIDDIIYKVGMSPTQAAQILLMLQMQGLIEQIEGRRYVRSP
jgi:DNA processing protein